MRSWFSNRQDLHAWHPQNPLLIPSDSPGLCTWLPGICAGEVHSFQGYYSLEIRFITYAFFLVFCVLRGYRPNQSYIPYVA